MINYSQDEPLVDEANEVFILSNKKILTGALEGGADISVGGDKDIYYSRNMADAYKLDRF